MIRARLTAFDDVNIDRLLKKKAEVKEGDWEMRRPVGEQRVLGPENDLAPFLVVDLLEDVGGRAGRPEIGPVRLFAGVGLELLVGERRGRIELQPVVVSGGKGVTSRADRRRRRGDPFEDRSAIRTSRSCMSLCRGRESDK